MIQLEQVFQSASFLVWDCLDIVNRDGLDVDGSCTRCPAEGKLGHSKRDKRREHVSAKWQLDTPCTPGIS